MDQSTGAVVGAANMTYPDVKAMLPYSRTGTVAGNGIYGIATTSTVIVVGYYTKDCSKAWK